MVALVLATACSSKSSGSSSSTPTTLDPTQPHYGKTMPEWSAAWWQYIYAQPGTTNPLLDATGAHCAQGQDGKSGVFMLVGNSGGAVERTCTVPKDLAILFPIVNGASDNGGVPPAQQLSDAALVDTANSQFAAIVAADLHASFDGVDIPNLPTFAVSTPVKFDYTVPPGDNLYNALGTPGVSGLISPSYSTGYYVMLAPPSTGTHVLKFSGHIKAQPTDFALSVTYHLVIQ